MTGYTSEVTGTAEDGFTVTNTKVPEPEPEPETTSITVTKFWIDDTEETRPSSAKVYLTVDGVKTEQSLELTAEMEWTGTFPDLPVDGSVYGVVEEEVAGYTSEITGNAEDGFTVTNTRVPEEIPEPEPEPEPVPEPEPDPETTSITVSKVWKDDTEEVRPESIKIYLTIDGEKTEPALVLAADTEWTGVFEGLPVNDSVYGIIEEEVEGYTSEITGTAENGFTVTNTRVPEPEPEPDPTPEPEPETTNITVTKSWVNDTEETRPSSAKVYLTVDGVKTEQSLELTSSSSWTGVFSDLPVDGSIYGVVEEEVTGYSSSVTGDVVNGFTVTNTRVPEEITEPEPEPIPEPEPETTSITVTKFWVDDTEETRPSSVKVYLTINGEKTEQSLELTAEMEWTGTFPELPADGSIYGVVEEEVADYTSEVTGTAEDGFTVTNTLIPAPVPEPIPEPEPETTSITVTKVWVDDTPDSRPSSVKVYLTVDGVRTDQSLELTSSSSWTGVFSDLPVDGSAYGVVEEDVSGYTSLVTGDAETGFTVINTLAPVPESEPVPVLTVTVTKVWNDGGDGSRRSPVLVNLMLENVIVDSALLTADCGWTWEFTDLPVPESGTYTVEEAGTIPGYVSHITGDAGTGFVINNTRTTAQEIVKIWSGDSRSDRPESIEVQLYADSVPCGSPLTLTEAGGWRLLVSDLPAYDTFGDLISWTVRETTVPAGYRVSYKGFVITNTFDADWREETLDLPIRKVWKNDGNLSHDPVHVSVFADGRRILSGIELSQSNGWTTTVTGLPVYDSDGSEITYRIAETDCPDGYLSVITGSQLSGYVLTNRRITPSDERDDTKTVSIQKLWYDDLNAGGTRPDLIRAVLTKVETGEQVEVLLTDPSWLAEVELPSDGTWILTEDPVEGYTSRVEGDIENGFVLINTRQTGDLTEPSESDDIAGGPVSETEVPEELLQDEPGDQDVVPPASSGSFGSSDSSEETVEVPQTGDESEGPYLIFLALALAILGLSGIRRYSRK